MAAQDFRLPPPPAISAQAAALRAAFPGYTINVGVISGDWLLTGHIQVDTCTEAGCLDWHTVTLYRNGKEVLTIALSPSHDIELAQQLATRAECAGGAAANPQQKAAHPQTAPVRLTHAHLPDDRGRLSSRGQAVVVIQDISRRRITVAAVGL
jgi:hypothetical protein